MARNACVAAREVAAAAQRAVIVLRYYEDLSEQEIADALGCSRGNVKSTAHHALEALRAALGSDGTDGRED